MWEYNTSAPDIYHYGVLGMKWGVRHDKSRAFRNAAHKADKLERKTQKATKKYEKAVKKNKKSQKRFAGFGLTTNRALLRRTKQVARTERKLNKRIKKSSKWRSNMEKTFKNVRVSDISQEDLTAGRDYVYMLLND